MNILSSLTWILSLVRRHKIATAVTIVVLIPIVLVLWYAFAPVKVTYQTAVAVRGDLVQTVEAVGTVTSDRDLKLQFPLGGVVASVFVQEGDVVKSGQRLVQLKSGTQAADVAAAAGRLAQAQANLRALEEGARPEDIAIVRADLASKESSLQTARQTVQTATTALTTAQARLDALKSEAATGLSGLILSTQSQAAQQLTVIDNALSVLKTTYLSNDFYGAFLWDGTNRATTEPLRIDQLRSRIQLSAQSSLVGDYRATLEQLEKARTLVLESSAAFDAGFSIVQTIPETSNFTPSVRTAYQTTIATQRGLVQAALSAIDSASKTLRDASASYETRITTEEANVSAARGSLDRANADIATYSAAVEITRAQLTLKTAPARETDRASAVAAVAQARASLAAASANYSNTIITAPVAGTVTKVNVKPGEYTPVGPVVTMLGQSPFRIELYASEVDIPRVALGQTGSIMLDAFPGTNFRLHVTEIDTAATNKDGVNKYRIRLDFAFPHDDILKIGMTGDAQIITGERHDVVNVPVRAIVTKPDGSKVVRVMEDDSTLVDTMVETGMEGANGSIEIIRGVASGATVITQIK